ncbi:MAG TPA: TadE family protein [Sphingomicrobium sp.]|nr:TadE family protein [Sphingomicrobium sp.]
MIILRNERGAAVIELALVAPVLALTVVGIVDMSNAFSKKLGLEQGAQRAIEKIMNTTGDSTVESTLANEVQCQVNGSTTTGGVTTCNTSPTQTITVTWRLDCTTGGTTTSQSTTNSATYDGYVSACTGTKAGYVQVNVTDKYTPLFPIHFAAFNSGDSTYHLSATAGMRTF